MLKMHQRSNQSAWLAFPCIRSTDRKPKQKKKKKKKFNTPSPCYEILSILPVLSPYRFKISIPLFASSSKRIPLPRRIRIRPLTLLPTLTPFSVSFSLWRRIRIRPLLRIATLLRLLTFRQRIRIRLLTTLRRRLARYRLCARFWSVGYGFLGRGRCLARRLWLGRRLGERAVVWWGRVGFGRGGCGGAGCWGWSGGF